MQRRAEVIYQVTGVFLSSADSSAQHIAINSKAMLMQQPQHQLWNGWKRKKTTKEKVTISAIHFGYTFFFIKIHSQQTIDVAEKK